MGFSSFSLLLLLFLGQTYGLYAREAFPKDQATQQCSEATETETLFWRTVPDPAIKNDEAPDIPITVTRSCKDSSLLHKRSLAKRQRQPKGKNVFNAICQRELTGRRPRQIRTTDLELLINDPRVTHVPTPDGGEVVLWVDQERFFVDFPESLDMRHEMDINIVNRSGCRVLIEWLTRLHIWPGHSTMGASTSLQNRELEPTQRQNWETMEANECVISGLMPVFDAVNIGVRLIISAFTSNESGP